MPDVWVEEFVTEYPSLDLIHPLYHKFYLSFQLPFVAVYMNFIYSVAIINHITIFILSP